MDNITHEEKAIIDELRKRTINDVSPKMLEDDAMFYRFAKARDFNVVDAEAMLRKHIEWRKEYQIDTILTDYVPPEVLIKYSASSFVCFDKEGTVLRIQDWGNGDCKGMCNAVSKQELAKYWFYLAELDRKMVVNKGGNFKQPVFHLIYYLEGLTYAKAIHMNSLQYLIYGVKMLIDNYPECVRKISIVDAPFYFPWTYNVIKPVFPASVSQKMRIYGTDGWKEALLQDVGGKDLPAYLGGDKTDPDGNPLCVTFIQHGKTIPKSYYRQNEGKKLVMSPDAEKITVKAFSKEEISFEIKEDMCNLEWEFSVKKGDIDYSLHFKENSSEIFNPEELVPKQRVDTTFHTEKGSIKCDKAGKYIIIFDNTHSWLQSKEVYYKIGIKNINNN